MNSEPILEVRHLNVWYRPSGVLRRGRQQVLHDVSFDLYQGEILGLVGELSLLHISEPTRRS